MAQRPRLQHAHPHTQLQRYPLRGQQGPVRVAARAGRGRRLPAGDESAGTPARRRMLPAGRLPLPLLRCEAARLQRRRDLRDAESPTACIAGFGVPEFDDEGRYLEFQFGRLSVVSLYLPSGSSGPERQASKYRFLDVFLPYLKKLGRRDRDYVLCGDINIAHQRDRPEELEVEPEELRVPARGARLARSPLRRAQAGSTRSARWTRGRTSTPGGRTAARRARRTSAGASTTRSRARGSRARARKASIYRDTWFSDHAPLTMDYEL